MSPVLNDLPNFAKEAVTHFELIMSNALKDQMDYINKGNQGELFILKSLHLCDQAMTPSELSLAMGSSTARVSALLRILEKKEQIERKMNKNDRRFIFVSLTDKGKERVVEELGQMQKSLAKVFITLGAEDTREFLRLLALFSDLMKKQMNQLDAKI